MTSPAQPSRIRTSLARRSVAQRKRRIQRSASSNFWRLIAPWHWPTWLGFGIAWLIARLPIQVQFALGRGIARLFFRIAPRRAGIIRKNIELAFPRLEESERDELARETINSLGMTMAETLLVWMRGVDSMADRVQISGLEHLQPAEEETSSGIVLLGAHFASLDLVAAALARKCPFGATYRRTRNPVVDWVCQKSRGRYYDQMLEATNLRALAKALSQGRIVWFATDQDMGNRKSVCFVPFFGINTSTVVTPFRLAKKTKARVVFMSHKRNPETLTWELNLEPVELAQTSVPSCFELDATNVNGMIEDFVRANPEQYFWAHRRFKTLANGTRRDY